METDVTSRQNLHITVSPVAKFLVTDRVVYSRLWHWVVLLARQPMYTGGPVRTPYARVDYIPQRGTKNLATVFIICISMSSSFSCRHYCILHFFKELFHNKKRPDSKYSISLLKVFFYWLLNLSLSAAQISGELKYEHQLFFVIYHSSVHSFLHWMCG